MGKCGDAGRRGPAGSSEVTGARFLSIVEAVGLVVIGVGVQLTGGFIVGLSGISAAVV